MAAQQSCVLAVGPTGDGKSALLNVLSGTQLFVEANGRKSVFTCQTTSAAWLGKKSMPIFKFVDSNGFGDSEGMDAQNLQKLSKQMDLSHIKAIVVTFNILSFTRLSMHHKLMLHTLVQCFGIQFWRICCFIFTHCEPNANPPVWRAKLNPIQTELPQMIQQEFHITKCPPLIFLSKFSPESAFQPLLQFIQSSTGFTYEDLYNKQQRIAEAQKKTVEALQKKMEEEKKKSCNKNL